MAAFTTIATAAGLAATAATTGMSFAQAGKQKQAQRQAEQDATLAMDAARKKLEVNFYAQQGIKKEPYELERDALLAQGAQAIQAGVESERGAAATAGRVQLGMNEAQAGIRTAMGNEMTAIDTRKLAEDSRLQGLGYNLDIAESQGAGQAAAVAGNLSAQALSQGMAGVNSLGQQVATALPLYQKTQSAKITNKIQDVGANQYGLQQSDIQKSIGSAGVIDNVDFSRVGNMNELQFKAFMGDINPSTLKKLQEQFPNIVSSFRPDVYKTPSLFPQSSLGAFAVPGIGG
jgi:hypothetical protein